jgi:hypothetical protein
MADADLAVFEVPVDFTGVVPWDPTKGGVTDPEPGGYAGKTRGAWLHTSAKGGKSIKITVALSGGPETDLYLGLDFSKPSNVQKVKTALGSMYGADAVEKMGQFKLTPAAFMGRDGQGAACYVIVRGVEGTDDKGRKKLNDKEFATKGQFESFMAAMGTGGGAPAPASVPGIPGGNGAPAPAAGAEALKGLFGPG